MSCISLFVLLSFFFWPLCFMCVFDLRMLSTPLVSSKHFLSFFGLLCCLSFFNWRILTTLLLSSNSSYKYLVIDREINKYKQYEIIQMSRSNKCECNVFWFDKGVKPLIHQSELRTKVFPFNEIIVTFRFTSQVFRCMYHVYDQHYIKRKASNIRHITLFMRGRFTLFMRGWHDIYRMTLPFALILVLMYCTSGIRAISIQN